MYSITSEVRELLRGSHRETALILFSGVDDELTITESDILSGGLSVNRYSVSGDRIEIGSAVAGELSLTLDNADGRYNNVTFEGGEMYVRLGISAPGSDVVNYIPLGYFTVDEAPRKLMRLSLTALDRMVRFDKTADVEKLTFPTTSAKLVREVCTICNVPAPIELSSLPNGDTIISTAPTSEDLTYRQIISWIAEMTGTCAYIDRSGYLAFGWYASVDETVTTADRVSSDIDENALTITGVCVTSGEDEYLSGEEGYVLNIEENELVDTPEIIAKSLAARLVRFSYTPFTATVLPMPHLDPLDMITFVDGNGTSHICAVTDVTFGLNTLTKLKGSGETETKSGYASMNPLTNKERVLYKALEKNSEKLVEAERTAREQAVTQLANALAASSGMYITVEVQPDGSSIYYMHNKALLEESDIVWKLTAEAFAISTDGGQTYPYGFTITGELITRLLYAEGINADYIDTGALTVRDSNGDIIFSVDCETGSMIAMSGTIGGFNISDSAIYSGDKDGINNTASGIYLGADGQIYIGDGTNRIRYYQSAEDGKWKLDISANSIKFGSGNTDIEEAIEQLKDEVTTSLYIGSSNGTVFKNDSISTVLTVTIYRGAERITNMETLRSLMGENASLQWSFQRLGEETYYSVDPSDTRIGNGGFTFTLVPNDIDAKATFLCELVA